MNSFNMRCSLEFTVKAVTCSNAWIFSAPLLPYVHVNIHVFDQRFTTRNVSPLFPLKFNERFCLTKTFMQCYNLWDFINALAGERIQIALAHVNYSGVSKNVATFESNLLKFLFPDSEILFSYSDFKREIILTPVYTSHFRGIIGPRLQLSIGSLIREVFEAFDTLSDIRKKIPFDASFTPEKLIKCRARKTCQSCIETQVESVEMEDRPPFVVRRVDSKLISRRPSLYKEYEGKKAYCCYSPHRDGQCAACRMENVETRSKYSRPKPFRGPVIAPDEREKKGIAASTQKTKLSSEGLCMSCQQNKIENQQSKQVMTEPIEIMRTSPERVQRGIVVSSPSPMPHSPHVHWADNLVNTDHQRSPVFDRPTFNERYGNNDAGIKEKILKQKPNRFQTQLDQAQQTDFSYPDKRFEKHEMIPYFNCGPITCNCHHPLYYRYDSCSCTYCPLYWRGRFDAPICNSRSYWRDYHHGLANIYDDLQSYS